MTGNTTTLAGLEKCFAAGRRTSARRLVVAMLVAASAMTSATASRADSVAVPPVPANLEVPEGQRAYLMVHAVGTQNYLCLPRSAGTGLGWTFVGPQATAFNDRGEQVLTHFLSVNPGETGVARATWQHSRDTSAVWAVAIASSNDPAFVEAGAVPWLLLEATGSDEGPAGGAKLSSTTFVQRLDTTGGTVPAGDCPAVGARVFVPYEADYVFYRSR